MKILILTTALSGNHYNGCGWIGACIEYLSRIPNIQLGIGYVGTPIKSDKTNLFFFPIQVWNSRLNRLKRRFRLDTDEKLILTEVERIVDTFSPDIIHVFGSETPFGLISAKTKVPVLIHLQGFQPSYYNAKYPPGKSFDSIFYRLLLKNPISAFHFRWREKMYRYCVAREFSVIKSCQYFCGRTEWDYAIVDVIHPNAQYYYCSEFLRHEFYEAAAQWEVRKSRTKFCLLSVISPASFKGADVILKTAKWLRQFTDIDFEWNVYGVSDLEWQDPYWGKLCHDQCVIAHGLASASEIVKASLASDVFIHASYIDNSPNSICEAQMLGMPVIGTNVGGVSSIIQDNIDGILVPANDPLMMASRIKELLINREKAVELGKNAAVTAQKRHNPEIIVKDLSVIYQKMLLQ